MAKYERLIHLLTGICLFFAKFSFRVTYAREKIANTTNSFSFFLGPFLKKAVIFLRSVVDPVEGGEGRGGVFWGFGLGWHHDDCCQKKTWHGGSRAVGWMDDGGQPQVLRPR